MQEFDKKKFKFRELISNHNGKSSGSGFIGVILGLISGISFLAAMIGYWCVLPNTIEVMGEILKLVAASTLLLGVRKLSGNFSKERSDNNYFDNKDKG